MIQTTTLHFLKDLKNNNAKEWMDDNRGRYEDSKNIFLEFTQQVISGVSDFDATILSANLDPKKCVSLLNRDIRFSKDKTPYKTIFLR